MPAIGLHKDNLDPATGAPVTFYVLTQYTVRLTNGTGSQAVLQGYVSKAMHDQGRQPLAHIAVDLPDHPPAGDTLQWLYQQIPTVDGDLQGATPVQTQTQ